MKQALSINAVIVSVLIPLLLPLSLSGCATIYNPATERKEFILINTQSEVAIGESAVTQIGNKYRLSDNQQDLRRISRIGQRVAQVSDRQDLDYKFYLIEDEALNAFAIPGGHIYIFRGLYEFLDDNELACVLAHEVGHAAARHIVKRLQSSLGYQIISSIALAVYVKGKEERKKQAAYTAYAASTAFNLVQLGYSRKDELQADELAVKYADKAGFNPRGMISALKKLEARQEKGFAVPYIFRSHPYINERIEWIEQKIIERTG